MASVSSSSFDGNPAFPKYLQMMGKRNQLQEGSSLSGTFLYKSKADAEGTAAMLGLTGAFPVTTDEGSFWMPGRNYRELQDRITSSWILPDQATVPQPHPPLLDFKSYTEQHE